MLIFSIECSKCFNIINSDKCKICNTDENDIFFININQIFNSNEYSKIKEKYNLGFQSEVLRDQRTSMCTPMKQEIIANALHPNRIQKIIDLTKCYWWDLDKYI